MYTWLRFKSRTAPCERSQQTAADCTPRTAVSSRKSSQSISNSLISRSWLGTSTLSLDQDASDIILTTSSEDQSLWSIIEGRPSSTITQSTSTRASYRPRLQPPPRCRLPSSMRFTALLLYISFIFLFTMPTSATPLSVSHPHIYLQNRQSIPDKTGNTGNDPAPIRPQAPPQAPSPVQPDPTPLPPPTTISITSAPTSSSASVSSAPQPTSTITTGSNGNSNPNNSNGGNGNLGLNPGTTPLPDLRITRPQLGLSTGALAGIITGGATLILLLLGLSICIYRRTRQPEINEIPIRRSRLGSRLGRRMFGSLSASRSSSRASSRASLTGDARDKEAWLDKGTIGRPRPAWVENGLLGVPRPAFVRERDNVERAERWVGGRAAISAPRPGRPRSAEPLGRLSGMGMGMGYLR